MPAVLLAFAALTLPFSVGAVPAAIPPARPVNARGVAMYYQKPGLMEHVATVHNAMPPLPKGVSYYASSPYVRIVKGQPRYGTVTVRVATRLYHFMVMFGDESAPGDRAYQIAHSLVVELPYQAAHSQGWWSTGHASATLEGVTR